MAKPKLKQPPSKYGPETENCVEDGWIIVKKQKVTILIPPLPITEPPTIPNPSGTPPHPVATERADHITAPPSSPPLSIQKPNPLATAKPIRTCLKFIPHNEKPNFHKKVAICNVSRARNHCGSLFNGHILVNSKMRALNLDRKLQRAGGLDRWLASIGLGQFVNIFRCKRVGKVQLVNLTMKKLKDMGADAVGPRRKLMHAIDCLW